MDRHRERGDLMIILIALAAISLLAVAATVRTVLVDGLRQTTDRSA
jgi:hypothetical protein